MSKEGHEHNRGLAEVHYLIGNAYLYDNKEDCEKKANAEYIKAVNILVSHTKKNGGDKIDFPLPT